MKLKELTEKVNKRPKEWREGQAYFNYLYEDKPKLADEIRGTNLDPFYQDDNIESFIKFLVFVNY